MRLTDRNSRADADGRHNDRNYDVSLSDHIDQSKSIGNKYTSYLGDNLESKFLDIEKDFYKQHFEDYINKRNETNIKLRKKNRLTDIDHYYKGKRTRPEDKIIQIGKMDDSIEADILWECASEYMNEFNSRYGDKCLILDMALHVDEATPHIHIRRVWIAEDENGIEHVSQTKALEQLGFEAPDKSKEIGRFNNAKMTFTKADKELFTNICKEHGIEFDTPRVKGLQTNLSVNEFKRSKDHIIDEYTNEINKLKEEGSVLRENVMTSSENLMAALLNMGIINELERERIRKMELYEKIKYLSKLYEEYNLQTASAIAQGDSVEMATLVAKNKQLEKEVDTLRKFLTKKGIEDEYYEYSKKNTTKEEII